MIVNTQNLIGTSSLDRILETRDSYIHYVDNNIYFEAKEGMDFTFSREIDLLIQATELIGNVHFVYISNQCQHAAVFLYDYKYLEMLPNLIGIAIVTYYGPDKKSLAIDESRFKHPIKLFDSLHDAKKWSKKIFSKKEFKI